MKIISFGQVVDLEKGGKFTQQITVLLPDGHRATIETDEATVQQLIQLAAPYVQGTEVKHFEPEEEQYRQEPEPTDDMDAIFGGEDVPTEPPEAKLAERPTEPPEVPPSNGGGLGSGRAVPVRRRPMVDKDGFAMPIPSRTVEKDEMGYPIVERSAAPPVGDDGADDGDQI